MNSITIIGRTGDLLKLQNVNDKKKGSISVCVDNGYKDAQGNWKSVPTWFTCIGWEKMAEKMNAPKGCRVIVHGRVSIQTFEDQNGIKRLSVWIDCYEFEQIHTQQSVQ